MSHEHDTVGGRYASTRARVTALLTDLPEAGWTTPVPACPGWRVRDVLAHLVGNLEDGAAGRITGPPSPELTDEQVARHRDDDAADLLATWAVAAPLAEPSFTQNNAWPAFIDLITHEHDLRTALGRPGDRDHDDVRRAARLVGGPIDAGDGRSIAFDLGDGSPPPEASHVLTATPFEVLRVRLGRRSVEQVRALAWSADPTPVLDRLFVFGPSETPQHEEHERHEEHGG
jgi:uncharacterized protein (TIGR03083 family)